MAEFTDLNRLRPCTLFSEMDVNMEMMKQIPQLSPSMLENLNCSVTDFSVDSFLAHQQPEFPPSYIHTNNHLSTFCPDILSSIPIAHAITSNQNVFTASKKRKEVEQSSSSSKNISPAASTTNTRNKNSSGRCKKGKNKEKGMDKAEEVIHVRAKRGQATDSHSIAERVRREKINNKLKCLQDLVPGCHKSMGMAVMLEEIINYVHSLQNQVEFLSMELAAASCSYDLNLETETPIKSQGTNSPDAQEMQKLLRQRNGEFTCFHPTWSI